MAHNTDISATQDTGYLLIINALMVRFSIYSLRVAKLSHFIYSLHYPFTYTYIRLKTLSDPCCWWGHQGNSILSFLERRCRRCILKRINANLILLFYD